MASAEAGRFPSLSEEDFDKILDDRDSKNMKNVIKVSVKVWKDYLTEKAGDFSDVSEMDEAARPAPVMSYQH
jgi:hypothetical protein